MSHFNPILNAFIEDTCVLVVIAYLLARGRMLDLLTGETRGRNGLLLGLLLGLVGCTEVIFPGARSPYVLHALIVCFATLRGGLRMGAVAAATVLAGVGLLHARPGLLPTALILSSSVLTSGAVRRIARHPNSLLVSLLAGMAAQCAVILALFVGLHSFYKLIQMGAQTSVVLAHQATASLVNLPPILHFALVGIPANGFGVLLLQLVVREAQTRADSERHRLEAERAHALAAEAQLSALRARVHPHFLFNTLTSIAALCGIAPDRAEHAITRLSMLMRAVLQTDLAAPQSLRQELEYTRAYLEIEQYRFGARLQVTWHIEPGCESAMAPAFALQTLVENAVGHGLAPRPGVGHLDIYARSRRGHIMIAVRDDGVGIAAGARQSLLSGDGDRPHGLQIVAQQLTLLYGPRSRPRILSVPERGTLVAFVVPHASSILPPGQRNTVVCSMS
jgi:signal transduction histidine kinase